MGKLKFPMPRGFVAPGFEKVMQVFSENYAKGWEKGSSFAVYYKGQPVVNIWGGLADWQVKRAWQEDTMGCFHSTTKFMAAVTMAHLVERDKIRYEEKISKYWPDFEQNGKENITLEQLLSYQAGLAAISSNFQASWMRDDPQGLYDVLVKQKPLWSPGTARGYHPMTIGFYLNELVKRVDTKGRTLAQYFDEEIAKPFGIDFYIGCPKSLFHRLARLEPLQTDEAKFAEAFKNFKGDIELYKAAFSQPKDWNSPKALNNPDFVELPVPSSHGVGTALGVAKVMGILANGGQYEGKVLLEESSITKLQEPLSHGIDLTVGDDGINGRGTFLFPVIEEGKHWYMFGHPGYGDQIGMADSQYKVGFAYTTNMIDPLASNFEELSKWRPLMHALFQCVHQIEGLNIERKVFKSRQDLEKEVKLTKVNSKL